MRMVELTSLQLPCDDFIGELNHSLQKLSGHHFIAKKRGACLKHGKENLVRRASVVLMGVAENYSFLIQDAVQGFHWNNAQATPHPFVVY